MTFFRRLALSASMALLALPAFAPVAFAQTTPLPELAPEVIAADVATVFIDGEARRAAPTFDPFEGTEALAGRANLREARGEVDRLSGEPIFGDGAILDLALLYTASADEFDLRGYDGAVFLNGERVRSTRYNPVTRECSSRVSDVVYRDDYYAGVSHGLVLGLYSAFPRYRGHRNYDFFLDGYRRPSWRRPARYARHGNFGHGNFGHGNFGRGGFGGYRDGYRDGYSHGGFRDRGYSARRDGSREGRREGRREDRAERREDRRDTPRPLSRNPRVGTGIGPLNTERMRNAPRRNDAIAGARANRQADSRTRPDTRRNESRQGEPRRARSERREPRVRTVAPATPATPAIQQRREDPRARPRMENAPRASAPRSSAPRAAAPRPEPRRTEPRRSEPRRSEPRRSERANRATDRAFQRGNARIRRGLEYYPQGSYVGSRVATTVDTRCAKEEQLALFIPAERLDAARFDGLTVLVVDGNGAEIPVFVPPNYIEGFQQGLRRGETVIR